MSMSQGLCNHQVLPSQQQMGMDDVGSQVLTSSRSGELIQQVVFRLLCPSQRAGSVIGKGGEVIQELRQTSKAKIKVEPTVPNSEEREILISSPNNFDDEGVKSLSAAEYALQLVIERIYEDCESENVGGNIHIVRMLISHNQVGPLLGKQGSVIQQLRNASGANIRILTQEHLPSCAMPNDQVLQIAGEWRCVKSGLQLIASKLRMHPPQSTPLSYVPSPLNNTPTVITGQQVDTSYRLLVSHNKIGSIIGKGGEMIKCIRSETKARVKIYESSNDSDVRIICAQSVEDGGMVKCAAGEAVMKCVTQIINDAARMDSEVRSHTIRLLVPTSQAGAVIGREGMQIREIIKETGANIRFFQGDSLPVCAETDDELLQIDGAPLPCLQALQHCLVKLRENMARYQLSQQGALKYQNTQGSGVSQSVSAVYPHVYPPFVVPHDFDPQYPVSPSPVGPIMNGNYYSMPASVPVDNPPCSLNLQLTPEQTGKLVGPHGRHINHVRQVCNAVKVYLHQSSDTPERNLEISGTMLQVQQCAHLVLSFLGGMSIL
eukprot:TRINITY_DN15756_c0_g1_i1.p1 TRINITY_DN15756_c0_g1~~TRINITY_DN15756_c0_g1_i1.p1  ORF type:complete len:547 (-),score=59.80 TRINITY_DN15756_c0_g1_i1:119-1759(-)